jgi:hypothetical protein
MRRYLDIENNIQEFINGYNRNYNNINKSLYTCDDVIKMSDDPSTLNYKNWAYDKTLTMNDEIVMPIISKSRLSLSLSSINSAYSNISHQNLNNPINTSTLTSPVSNKNDKRKRRNFKSETDLYDMLNNSYYQYYFEENNITYAMMDNLNKSDPNESNSNWNHQIDRKVTKNEISNKELNFFQKFKNNITKKRGKRSHNNDVDDNNNKSLNFSRIVHNSLSTVDEFFTSLSDSMASPTMPNDNLKSFKFYSSESSIFTNDSNNTTNCNQQNNNHKHDLEVDLDKSDILNFDLTEYVNIETTINKHQEQQTIQNNNPISINKKTNNEIQPKIDESTETAELSSSLKGKSKLFYFAFSSLIIDIALFFCFICLKSF